jgi:UDP-N-acetylglucosamine--N-acetylmuramyl-(pentapeptide) pyrophosphoryl-undecaprenol N-acetylglucosamine transferase
LLPAADHPDVWHQAGAATLSVATESYAAAGVQARVDRFIDDVAEAYGWADLVICRAGALTISELTAAGLGAVLVPYPSAADDHQTSNAQFLVAAGAAVMFRQTELTPEVLAAEIDRCMKDRQIITNRAIAARSLARPDATRDVVESCLALVNTS